MALAHPDAHRSLLDGLFMLDPPREVPLRPRSRVYTLTIRYYAWDPVLSFSDA